MLTLIHAPNTRSTRILVLIDEMRLWDQITIRTVDVISNDGTGRRDPANPHPEGKVPALIHDGQVITESAAIMLRLTLLFPDASPAPQPDSAAFGPYLTWLVWYQAVVEPVMMMQAMGLHHPGLHRNFRGLPEIASRLHDALTKGPWLCGDGYTAADLICASAFTFMPHLTPDDPLIRDWIARYQARPALAAAKAYDVALLATKAA